MVSEASATPSPSPASAPSGPPRWSLERSGQEAQIGLTGCWTAEYASDMEAAMTDILAAVRQDRRIVLNLSRIDHLDTAGAWVLDRTRHELKAQGYDVVFMSARDEHRLLLDEVDHYEIPPDERTTDGQVFGPVVELGHVVADLGKDFLTGLAFLGEFMITLGRVIARPRLFRGTSLVYQLDLIALRGVPIIALISFLVGGIIAQQGIFQLRRFGASSFVVDLVGILTLRELGVLLTAIMVAGRSGSAFTAEIGSMKMREEIDAIRVMGLDPMEVLIIPRLLALIVGLPMLTFLSDIAALSGGGLVAWLYEGINPDMFLARLKEAIALNTFMVGLIKAPFMALIIGLIASIEGFAVQGSAESLGRHVTSSVVKTIFMVIVLDGLFAMFFAAVEY